MLPCGSLGEITVWSMSQFTDLACGCLSMVRRDDVAFLQRVERSNQRAVSLNTRVQQVRRLFLLSHQVTHDLVLGSNIEVRRLTRRQHNLLTASIIYNLIEVGPTITTSVMVQSKKVWLEAGVLCFCSSSFQYRLTARVHVFTPCAVPDFLHRSHGFGYHSSSATSSPSSRTTLSFHSNGDVALPATRYVVNAEHFVNQYTSVR